MNRLISMMVILLLASACSARGEARGNAEDRPPVRGGPAADLAAPADREPEPDLLDGNSSLVRRHMVDRARTDGPQDQAASTEAPPEPARTIAMDWEVEDLMRDDQALAEAVESIGGDIFDQADGSRYLRVYTDGTFEWIRLARDQPVHPRSGWELAQKDPGLRQAMQSISDRAGVRLAIRVYADGSWEWYRIVRDWGPPPTGDGDTLCGPTECDP